MPRISSVVVSGLVLLTSACGKKAEPAQPAEPTATATQPRDTTPATPAPASTPAPAPAPSPAAPSAQSKPAPSPKPTQHKTPVAVAPTSVSKPSASPTVPAQAADAGGELHDQWHPAPRDTLDDETYQGWKQFELNCSRCHGEYAVGSSFAPALVVSLKEGGTIPTKEAFITTVCAGRLDKGMPSWCALGLEMNKIEEIYKYVKGRADGKIAIGRPALRE